MSLSASIAKNTAVQVAGKVVGTLLGLLALGIMTRYLSVDGYGAFTIAMAYLQIVGTVVDFGLTLTMLTMLSRPGVDEEKVASNILTLRLVSGVVFFTLAPIVALLFGYSAEIQQAIVVGSVSFFAIVVTQVLTSVLQKHLAGGLVALNEVTCRVLLLVGMAVVVKFDGGLLGVVTVVAGSNIIQAVLAYVAAGRLVQFRLAWDMAVWRQVIAESWPIGISIAFNLVYLKGDVLLLSYFGSQTEVGLYGAAYKVLDVITIVPMIFMGMVTPALTSAWSLRRAEKRESGKAEVDDVFGRRLSKAFDAMVILAIPLGMGTWFVGEKVMRLVAGEEFAASGASLAILMVAASMVFFGALFGHAVVALGLQRPMIAAYAANAVLSLGLYVWLIPIYGAVAAAWVTVFSEAFIAVVAGVVVLRVSRVRIPLATAGTSVAAGGVMVGVLVVTGSWPLALQLPAAVLTYFGSLWVFGGVSVGMVRELMGRQNPGNGV